jgi:FKBP-type peptidyl-prolyl cis-trans isomerase
LKKTIIFIFTCIVLVSLLLAGCGKGENRVIKNGDRIQVEYTGTLVDGTQFDSNMGGDPPGVHRGAGEMIRFDKAVVGMKLDETKTVQHRGS